jgi:hypothetical protein
LNKVPHPASSNYDSVKQFGDYLVGGYPKPGGKQVTLPTSWYTSFKGITTAVITVGNSGGTNLTYYGRFDGDSARLRIWYTQ